jgi:hypothetical protein
LRSLYRSGLLSVWNLLALRRKKWWFPCSICCLIRLRVRWRLPAKAAFTLRGRINREVTGIGRLHRITKVPRAIIALNPRCLLDPGTQYLVAGLCLGQGGLRTLGRLRHAIRHIALRGRLLD